MATQTTTEIAAEDGIEREFSMDPAVHRPLIVVNPPMQGHDVANLLSDTYLRKDRHGHRIVTVGALRIIREPETCDEQQLAGRQRQPVQRRHGRPPRRPLHDGHVPDHRVRPPAVEDVS